jgi:hypothetical protein
VPNSVHPAGVSIDVTLFAVTTKTNWSPDSTEPGTTTEGAIVFSFDEAAARNEASTAEAVRGWIGMMASAINNDRNTRKNFFRPIGYSPPTFETPSP